MNTRDEGDGTHREKALRETQPATQLPGEPELTSKSLNELGLSLTELSPTEWRVVDALRADDDAARVLGFIQRVADAYEVTSLLRLRERTYFSSFDRAAASLAPRSVLGSMPGAVLA